MVALVKVVDWRREGGAAAFLDARRLAGPGLRRAGRILSHAVAWPLLVKAGLFTGFALAASVLRMMGA